VLGILCTWLMLTHYKRAPLWEKVMSTSIIPYERSTLVNNEKYIGLDVHQATISIAVMDSTGKVVMESILETKAATILEFFAGLRGTLSVTFEEGTWAAWLYDVLEPHVAKLLVCNPRKNALLKDGNKSDRIDARKLAELLFLNKLSPVYHGETGVRMLRELARSYLTIVKDLTRVMSRLKAVYRSWAIPCAGRDVYYRRHRDEWLGKIKEAGVRRRAEQLYQQLDMLQHLVSKLGENCWRRVEDIPSPPGSGRFRRSGPFAQPWPWR
jgi:transposase